MEALMASLSVVIPTYNRGEILLNTIDILLNQDQLADEIFIVDQTYYDEGNNVAIELAQLHESNKITWIQLDKPSIPHAMNVGLHKAKSNYVLFLDDDVLFTPSFIAQHKLSQKQSNYHAYVGQILQPWQAEISLDGYLSKSGFLADLDFPFHSNRDTEVRNCMAGNLCVNRQSAIDVGGFDQQFSGAAYRFETEFCRRMVLHKKQPFLFSANATLNHLKFESGGTRKHAKNHLTSLSAAHSVGDYYFALCQFKQFGQPRETLVYILKRLFGSVIAKFYLKKPWWIPVRLIAEFLGLVSGLRKALIGPKYYDFN